MCTRTFKDVMTLSSKLRGYSHHSLWRCRALCVVEKLLMENKHHFSSWGRRENQSSGAAALPQRGGGHAPKHVALPAVSLDRESDLMESMRPCLWLFNDCFGEWISSWPMLFFLEKWRKSVKLWCIYSHVSADAVFIDSNSVIVNYSRVFPPVPLMPSHTLW